MKKRILTAITISTFILPIACQAKTYNSQKMRPYNVAVHQSVAALLNAQVIKAVKNGSKYSQETLIAQSLEWPAANLVEYWLAENPNLDIGKASMVALIIEIHMKIRQLEIDNKHGVIPFPKDSDVPIKGMPPTSIKLPPYQYITGPYGTWEPYPMALEEAEISALSPK